MGTHTATLDLPKALPVGTPTAPAARAEPPTSPEPSDTPTPAPTPVPAPRRFQLTTPHIATIARVVFIVLALLAFCYLARAVILPVLLALVIAMLLKAPVRWLHRARVPMALAAALVVSVFVTGIGFAAVYLARPAVEWLAKAPENLPQLRAKFQHVIRPAAKLTAAASSVGTLAAEDTARKLPPVEVKDNSIASTVFNWTGSLLAKAGETVALVFLLLASGDLFLQKLVHVMPRLRDKKQAVEMCREIQLSVSTYLLSVTLVNIGLGMATGIAFNFLGLPNAPMWGGVVMFANYVPYIGPILGIIAVGIAGLLAFDTVGAGLLPAGAYCLLHLIECTAVTPFVLGRKFTINPVLIFVALIFFTWLWGIVGALLSVPILVTTKIICDRIPALGLIGEFLASQPTPETSTPAASAAKANG